MLSNIHQYVQEHLQLCLQLWHLLIMYYLEVLYVVDPSCIYSISFGYRTQLGSWVHYQKEIEVTGTYSAKNYYSMK